MGVLWPTKAGAESQRQIANERIRGIPFNVWHLTRVQRSSWPLITHCMSLPEALPKEAGGPITETEDDLEASYVQTTSVSHFAARTHTNIILRSVPG
jgi:hypothetical protein